MMLTISLSRADSGSSYSIFAGKEAARALAVMSLKPEDCTGDISDLTDAQLKTLQHWKTKFEAKYPVVGVLK
jgi:membrane-associated progesterone receptor component